MTAPKESPGAKAIRYAEEALQVHAVHTLAQTARNTLDATLTDLSKKRDQRRNTEAALADREFEIISDERAKHADMSQAQMDKHVKVAIQKDAGHSGIRAILRSIAEEIDGLECDKDIAEADIKIAVARMTELGGYFNYLAVIKQAQSGGNNASAVAEPTKIPGW